MIPRHEWKAQVYFEDAESGETDMFTTSVYTVEKDEHEAANLATFCPHPFAVVTLLSLQYEREGAAIDENVALPF